MSDTATSPQPAGQVEQLDPRTLLVDANVRQDARLDPAFVASIKDLGVLEPIIAVRTAEGAIRVRLGHRRTLAAIEAGRATVPVLVIADEDTSAAAQTDRIIGQYHENTWRTGLTQAEEVTVVATLADFGLTPAQIAKRTKMGRAKVDAAKTIAGSELALAATARYDFLTLDQAAALAEFENDEEAVRVLTAAAQNGAGSFGHVVQRLRDSKRERQAQADAQQACQARGLVITGSLPWTHQLSYLTSSDGQQLTAENHADCPGHAAFLRLDWEKTGEQADEDDEDDYQPVWLPVYICTDPDAHGHQNPSGSVTRRAAAADPETARAERREVITNNKAWRSAETVRREWLTTFLARKTPPKNALRYVLGELAIAHWRLCNKIGEGHQLACKLLGIDGGREALVTAITTAADSRAQVIALALILGAYEDHTSTDTWRNPTPQDRNYFQALAGWGYELSDIERTVLGDQDPADASAS